MTQTPVQDSFPQAMIDLVTGMARALVDQPDQVHVDSVTDDNGTVLLLRVAPADLGKVIGKQGRTARSIRTILGAASMKAQHRYALDIQQAPKSADDGAEAGSSSPHSSAQEASSPG